MTDRVIVGFLRAGSPGAAPVFGRLLAVSFPLLLAGGFCVGRYRARTSGWNSDCFSAAAGGGFGGGRSGPQYGARGFQRTTPAEEARAAKHDGLSLFAFAPAIGPSFSPGKYPKTEELYAKVKKEIADPINIPKNHWQRKRPYEVDLSLGHGQPEKSPSYPSGHSTRGTVYAAMLAEIFPDKRDEILAIGREIGWDRVLIGKHFPTDIYAGRVLAKAIFRELMASPAFQHDLAEAKEEASKQLVHQ